MPVIALFSTSHCHADEIAASIVERLGLQVLTDDVLLAETAARSNISADRIKRAVHEPRSLFNRWTRERERSVAALRVTLAKRLEDDRLLYHGTASLLIPSSLTHVLRVCIAAKIDYRLRIATAAGMSERAARSMLQKADNALLEFSDLVLRDSPWNRKGYDIFLPIDSMSVDEAADLISDNAGKPALRVTPASRQAVLDFQFAARVNEVLTQEGHDLFVESRSGEVTVTIDHYVLRLAHLQEEIKRIVTEIPGVVSVRTRIGPHFNQPNIYPKLDIPRKILLVDDEREFVRTLSERLQGRDLEAALAYDGEEAMTMVETDAPDVMVLDMKMPGMDGLEVLRRVKRQHPATQVIILTGHGSEAEEAVAMALGAFAYLHKPADIDLLADTMKAAYRKAREAKEQLGGSAAATPAPDAEAEPGPHRDARR